MSSSTALKSACLSLGLASAWAPSAEAEILTRVHFESQMIGDVSHALVMLGSIGSGGDPVFLSGVALPGLGSGNMFFDIPRMDFGNAFAMIGVTAGSGGDLRLVVTAGGGSGLYGITFEEAFPGVSEGALIAELLSNDPAARGFLQSHFSSLAYTQGLLNNVAAFSVGQPFGSVLFEAIAVPTPGSIAVVGIGVLACRRRRR